MTETKISSPAYYCNKQFLIIGKGHLRLIIFKQLKCWYSHEGVSCMWTPFFRWDAAEKRTENHTADNIQSETRIYPTVFADVILITRLYHNTTRLAICIGPNTLRMEERPPIWRVVGSKLNKQSRTAEEGWSSSLGVGRGANNASPWKPMLRNIHKSRCFLQRQNDPEVIRVVGTGWSWLRIGTGGRHLWVRWGTFGFQKCGEFLD